MRKLVICLLVFGLYAIQTVVGHMNSDPAPGRSPGPPIDFPAYQALTNDDDIFDNNTYNNGNNSNDDRKETVHIKNENVAATTNDTTVKATTYVENHKNNLRLNTNNNKNNNSNNESEIEYSDRVSVNGSYRQYLPSTKLYNYNDNNNQERQHNVKYGKSDNDQINDEITSSATSRLEDAINIQLSNENTYNSPRVTNSHNTDGGEDDGADDGDVKTTYNYSTNSGEATIVVNQQQQQLKQMTLNKNIDLADETHEKLLRQHIETIPAISNTNTQHNTNVNMETSSKSLFSTTPDFSASSSSPSPSPSASSSCHSDLNNFLNNVPVIEVDDNNDSFSNTSSSLPPLLRGFKIQLQLYHDVFDASTTFCINCGILYKGK